MPAIEVSANREICCQYTEIMHSFRVVLSQSDHPSGANEAPGTGQNMACHISIDDYPLSPSKTVKYLGVTLSSNLSLSEHINSVCKTAKYHLGLVNQKLHQASPQVCHAIYPSTILSKLDYCCVVWDPHYSTDKTALNRVQLFASKVITHKWHANHSTMLNSLNWLPLEIRKRLIKIKVCYNIPNNYSCIPSSVFNPHPYSGLRHFHDRMLLRLNAKTYSHRYSFLLILYPFGILYLLR